MGKHANALMAMSIALAGIRLPSGDYIRARNLTDSTGTGGKPCRVCGKSCPPKRYACSPEHYREWMKGGDQG